MFGCRAHSLFAFVMLGGLAAAGPVHAQSAGVRYEHIGRSAVRGPMGPADLRGTQSVLTARAG